jgi:uncharacterized protein YceH (UPF0502 family)
MLRRVGLALVAAILVMLMVQSRAPAQSISNLQADLFNLRSQVSQLRAQVNQLSRQNPSQIPSGPTSRGVPRLSSDPTDRQMLDRLAILAIEAKDRLNSLEERVSRLEQRIK